MSNGGMPSKYAGRCKKCGQKFPVGTYINWDPATKKAEHFEKCPEVSYDGTEQAKLFEMWVRLGQETARANEHPLARADRRHDERMWEDTSPHLSQPNEDIE